MTWLFARLRAYAERWLIGVSLGLVGLFLSFLYQYYPNLTIGLATVALIALIFWAYWFVQRPSPGNYSPRKLLWYRLPWIHPISWNFENCLNIAGPYDDPKVRGFSPSFKINWKKGIQPKAAFIFCEATGERDEVLIECGNPYLPASEIEFVSSSKWQHCKLAYPEAHGRELRARDFLKRFDGFDYVFDYDNRRFERHFSRKEIEANVAAYVEIATPHEAPQSRPKIVHR